MDKMPYKIKQEIRSYAKLQMKAWERYLSVQEMIESYGVPIENLLACADCDFGINPNSPPQTEALAFINNCECDDVEGTIQEIEDVFFVVC